MRLIRNMYIMRYVMVAALLSLGNILWAGYGDQQTISVGSPIPTGWVVISEQGSYYTIKNLNGASYGYKDLCLYGPAPIPNGWIAYSQQSSQSGTYYYIRYILGASYQSTETMIFGATSIPEGWIKTSEQTSGNITYFYIQNTNLVTATISDPPADKIVSTGVPVPFAGSGTDSNSSRTLNYSWTFGDGGTATVAAISHTYSNTGTSNIVFQAIFKVTDNLGYFKQTSRNITVKPKNLVACVITNPSVDISVTSGTAISFTGTATDSDPNASLTYSWDFDDGGTASGASVSHAFTKSGAYKVKLTATDSTNAAGSNYREIFVNLTPGFNFLAGSIGGRGNLDGTGANARFAAPGITADSSGTYMLQMASTISFGR